MISCITAVRNNASAIQRAMNSVFQQDGVSEYLVVDGASSDGTIGVIKQNANRLAWWCSEKDQGISDAFNKGLRKAQGDIVGIINADDWYEPGTFAVVRRVFAETDAEVIHGRVRYWQGSQPVRVADGDHRALRRAGSVNHPSVFVRRSVYERFGIFDTTYRYAMDYEILLRWLIAGVRFRYLPMVMANMSLGGISDAHRFLALREVRKAQRLHLGRPVADAQHLWLVGRYRLRQACEQFGLDHLVAWQRRRNRGMRSIEPSA